MHLINVRAQHAEPLRVSQIDDLSLLFGFERENYLCGVEPYRDLLTWSEGL
jgi:hypothetical protein